MKISRCPTCHAHISLDALVQDANAKGLLAAVAELPPSFASNLISYVGLFRPAKSDLNNGRALKLITETLTLCDNRKALAAALEQTVISIHAKRQQGTTQALKNHSYLNKVLESTKEQFYHPVNQAKKEIGSSVQIKSYSQAESPEESNRKHQEMMNNFKKR
jgi:hypothetical protein